jgi:hypothetical protein
MKDAWRHLCKHSVVRDRGGFRRLTRRDMARIISSAAPPPLR